MIRLLVVSGSPVEQSSTDVLLLRIKDTIVTTLPDNTDIEATFVKLNELEFIPCQSCGEAPTPEWCFYGDDLDPVLKRLADTDCLLIGSPIYFDSVSAQAKMFIDRCNCLRPADFENTDPDHDFIKLIRRRRPGAMVLVGGEKGWFEGARRTIAGFFKWVGVTNEGKLVYHSTDFHQKGDAIKDNATLAAADALGRKLAGLLSRQHG